MPGIFFLALAGAASGGGGTSLALGGELLAEGQWAAARAEGLRALAEAESPAEASRARLLAARASRGPGGDDAGARAEFEALWRDDAAPPDIRSAAAWEAGRAALAAGDRDAAFSALQYAFLNAREPPLFWRSGCSLYFLLKRDKPRRRAEPALWQALLSCRDAWPSAVWRECRPGGRRGATWASLPGRGIVTFYRTAIGPAIGSRCDLEPSCSEYFLRASRAHGLLGIPIMADRFVREPSVVSAKDKPVVMPSGRIRYADPLSDHDFWMKGKR